MSGEDKHIKLERRMLSQFDWIEARMSKNEDKLNKIDLHTHLIDELDKNKATKDEL